MGLASRILGRPAPAAQAVTSASDRGWTTLGGVPFSTSLATRAGVNMGPTRAMGLPAYYAGLRAIAEDCAKLPIEIKRRTGPRSSEVLQDHPVSRLLNVSPRPGMTGYTIREVMTHWAGGWGRGISIIRRDVRGAVERLDPVPPWRVQFTVDPMGEPAYGVMGVGGKLTTYRSPEILDLRGLTVDGMICYSIAYGAARQSLGAMLAAQLFQADFYGNRANPGAVAKHPGTLSDEAERHIAASIKEKTEGAGSFGLLVLEEGMEYEQLGVPQKDAQFIESYNIGVLDVARWLRVNPVKLMSNEGQTYSNREQAALDYLTDSLAPWFERWESEIALKLLNPDEEEYAEHDAKRLLRGDFKSTMEGVAKGIQSGIYSKNDGRHILGENPVDGGDVYLTPVNMTGDPEGSGGGDANEANEANEAGQTVIRAEKPQSDPIAAIAASHADAIAEVCGKLERLEADKMTRAKRKHGDDGYAAWLEAFATDHLPHVRAALAPVAEAMVDCAWLLTHDEPVPIETKRGTANLTQRLAEERCDAIRDNATATHSAVLDAITVHIRESIR